MLSDIYAGIITFKTADGNLRPGSSSAIFRSCKMTLVFPSFNAVISPKNRLTAKNY